MNANQRRQARRSTTPSLVQAHVALLAEHLALKARIAEYVRESESNMADVRVNVQYLLLDLEATKRENMALRQQLEER